MTYLTNTFTIKSFALRTVNGKFRYKCWVQLSKSICHLKKRTNCLPQWMLVWKSKTNWLHVQVSNRLKCILCGHRYTVWKYKGKKIRFNTFKLCYRLKVMWVVIFIVGKKFKPQNFHRIMHNSSKCCVLTQTNIKCLASFQASCVDSQWLDILVERS